MSEEAAQTPLPPLPVRRVGELRAMPASVVLPLPVPIARRRTARPLLAGVVGGGLLLGAVALALIAFFDPFNPCKVCGQVIEYPSQGGTHISVATPHPTYNSDPPTSGWHREEFPPNTSAVDYPEPLEDEISVHLMEHGAVIAWYSCPTGPACTAVHNELVSLGKAVPLGAPYHLYVMPRASLPNHAVIALGAWQHLEYLSSFSAQAINDFLQHFGGGARATAPPASPTPPQ